MKNRFRLWSICAVTLLLIVSGLPVPAKMFHNVRVTAYHSRRKTSGGSKPHAGTCAAPARWHGYYIKIPGVGWRRVTDTCRHGVDIWFSSAQACKRWGRKRMTIRVEAHRP